MTVSVIPNLDKRGSSETVERLGAYFKKQGITAYIPDSICCTDYIQATEDELFKKADIIITIGGDGTIIRYAKRAAEYGKPILGINAGRMGYLADIEQSEYDLLSKLKTQEYTIEERMMLHVAVKENGKIIGEYEVLNDAVVTINTANQYVTILGEIKAPGRYLITRDNLTLLEAIGMAGDLTIQGERSKILVMRQEGSELKSYYVDLRSKDVFASPVYNLKQNDVIYVEPNAVRSNQYVNNANSIRQVSTWLSLLSFITSTIILIKNW